MVKFSIFAPGRRDNVAASTTELPWSEFAAWLAEPLETDDKHAQGFSPLAGILPGKGGRINATEPAGFLALEYDHAATVPLLAIALERLAAYDAVIYTSASATPTSPRFRIVLRVARPITTDGEWRACVDAVGTLLGVPPASESRQRTRIWYRPITRGKMRPLVRVLEGGGAWDVDACPAAPEPLPKRAPADLALFPVDDRVRQAVAALASRKPDGAYMAGLICRDFALELEHATAITLTYAQAAGWDFDPDEVADRVEHAFEYARNPPGTALQIPAVAEVSIRVPRIEVGMHVGNDSGNADRLLANFGSEVRFAHGVGWLRWDGARWRATPSGPWLEAEACARAVREQGIALGGEAGEALEKWGRASGNATKIRGCLDIASNRPGVSVDVDELDRDPWLLNVANGTLDLRTGELRPPVRDDLITKIAGVPYEPDRPCPRFLRFVLETMDGDAELAAYLLRFLGYALTGSVTEHALGVWHGADGANGKSTLLDLMTHILGDYAGAAAPEILLQNTGGQHPTGLMDLRGRRLVVSNETPEGRRWNESLIKQLTGGDEVKARAMRQDFVGFRPTWKLILATNALPRVVEQGGSFWRRVQLVPWRVTFRGREDRTLGATLHDEAPGILALLVRACGDWRRGGLRPTTAVTAAGEDYRARQDTIGAFFGECVVRTVGARIARSELFRAYAHWCDSGNEFKYAKQAFFRVCEERGYRWVRDERLGAALDGHKLAVIPL